jgi:branched-chain amino acid transport system permease protein
MTRSGSSSLLTALAALALAAYPLVASEFGIDLATKIVIYAILALSLELLVGQTGLVCFGQAAFFGIAAYATVLFSPGYDATAFWWLAPAAVAASALAAFAMGALSLRTRGVYFIMVTLAFSQMAYYVFHDTPVGGGTDGIYLNATPTLALGETALLDLSDAHHFYYLTVAALVGSFGALALLMRSRFGRALAGIRANEQRMRAAGFSTYPYQLAAFTISGAIAGIAGVLFAVKDGFVNPELLSWHLSGSALIMIILGGLGHLRGAVVGAFAYSLLEELFQSYAIFGSFSEHWHLGLGATIIASVALLPRGLVGLPALVRGRLMGVRSSGGR